MTILHKEGTTGRRDYTMKGLYRKGLYGRDYIDKGLHYTKRELHGEELHKEEKIRRDYMKRNLYFSRTHPPTPLHSRLR